MKVPTQWQEALAMSDEDMFAREMGDELTNRLYAYFSAHADVALLNTEGAQYICASAIKTARAGTGELEEEMEGLCAELESMTEAREEIEEALTSYKDKVGELLESLGKALSKFGSAVEGL